MLIAPSPVQIVILVLACLTILVGYLGAVSRNHRHHLRNIPIRLHVNGTRGKSTVTRLIAGAFREAGYRTFAKTTGSAPRLILPTGDELELMRSGPASVSEQLEIVEYAARHGAEVLVMECMAVNPELQETAQDSLVQGTCSVITNARLDHQDLMGETLEEIAWCLAAVTPPGGTLVTAEQDERLVRIMADRAEMVGGQVVTADMSTAPTPEEFGRHEWPDNLAGALKVCELHGIDRQTAVTGMRKAPLDPGALFIADLKHAEHRVRFINAFAANDYASTETICREAVAEDSQALYLLINARADRARRSQDLARLVGALAPQAVFVIGDGATLLERLLRHRTPDTPLINLANAPVCDLLPRLAAHVHADGAVVGIGNIGGPAEELCLSLTQAAT